MKQTMDDIIHEELKGNRSIMAIMVPYDDPNLTPGDYKVTWDRDSIAEATAAAHQFNEWKKKGYVAYSVEAGGTRGTVLAEFDPEAERIIFAPPMQGGMR